MIQIPTFILLSAMTLLAVLLPIGGAILWCVKKKQPFTTVLIGAGIFFLFAIVLETIPKLLLFQLDHPVSRFLMSNQLALVVVAAFLAGIFEETGRLLAFKVFLKRRKDRMTAITYGIGHGGFEVLYLIGFTYAQYVVIAVMVNTGLYDVMIQELMVTAPDQVDAMKAIPEALKALTVGDCALALWERVSAVLIHIACSIVVYKAVREKGKFWLYPVAILLHASVDFFAGLYVIGVITNVVLVEVYLFVWAVVLFALCYFFLYKKMPKQHE